MNMFQQKHGAIMKHHSELNLYYTLIVLIVLTCQSIAQEYDFVKKLVDYVQPAVVTVIAYDENNHVLQEGNGFFINEMGHLITCRDFFYGATRSEVKTYNSEVYAIKEAIKEYSKNNLILLKADIKTSTIPYLTLGNFMPHKTMDVWPHINGKRVIAVTRSSNEHEYFTDGKISYIWDYKKEGYFIETSNPIRNDCYGCPIINIGGQVIGMVGTSLTSDQNCFFVIPVQEILSRKENSIRDNFTDWAKSIPKKVEDGYDHFRGLHYYHSNNYEEAINCFNGVIRQNPSNAKAWLNLGSCKASLKQWQQAENTFKKAMAIDPNNYQAKRGLHYIQKNREIKILENNVNKNPKDAELLYNLGATYREIREYE